MRRNSIVLVCVLICVVSFGAFRLNCAEEYPPKPFTVVSVRGDVSMNKASIGTWRRAYPGATLVPGDTVRTGIDGLARLTRGEAADILVKPNTTLRIGQLYDTDPGSPAVTLLVGRILVFVDRMSRILEGLFRFRVDTPSALAGVRGTSFSVTVSQDGTTEVGVFHGQVVVVAGNTEANIRSGQLTRISPGKKPDKPKGDANELGPKDKDEESWFADIGKKEKQNQPESGHGKDHHKDNGPPEPGASFRAPGKHEDRDVTQPDKQKYYTDVGPDIDRELGDEDDEDDSPDKCEDQD